MADPPDPLYVRAERVMDAMAAFGRHRLDTLTLPRALVLAVLGGAFITAGALFSLLAADGIEPPGVVLLVEGFAFGTGFFFVVLSEAVLFTEANVVLPATILDTHRPTGKIVRFWAVAFIGNFVGALLTANLIVAVQTYDPAILEGLREVVDRKMQYREAGGAGSWLRLVGSGILANWLVGMAAFFSMMGRTIIGKYIPVALAVTMFVAANFQHAPANMGYFSLLMADAAGPGWAAALGWNLVPAGIGNMIGATMLVALPFWYAFGPEESG